MALTQKEEQLLRETLIPASMQVTNPQHITNRGRGSNESARASAAHVDSLLKKASSKPVDLNNDPEVERKIAKIRFRAPETVDLGYHSVVVELPKQLYPGDLYAMGILRDEILALSVDALKRRIVTARARMIDEFGDHFPMHGPVADRHKPNNPHFVEVGAVDAAEPAEETPAWT